MTQRTGYEGVTARLTKEVAQHLSPFATDEEIADWAAAWVEAEFRPLVEAAGRMDTALDWMAQAYLMRSDEVEDAKKILAGWRAALDRIQRQEG
jgi:hypothetical protein